MGESLFGELLNHSSEQLGSYAQIDPNILPLYGYKFVNLLLLAVIGVAKHVEEEHHEVGVVPADDIADDLHGQFILDIAIELIGFVFQRGFGGADRTGVVCRFFGSVDYLFDPLHVAMHFGIHHLLDYN